MSDNVPSVGDFAGLSAPATALIENVSKAIGGSCKPWQIRRVAKAEAAASIIQAKAEADALMIEAEAKVAVSDFLRRTAYRVLEEEMRHQENMESITFQALPYLEEDASPGDVDQDWYANFFAKSRIVTDKTMQDLWARLLAGEANKPKSFSKRTLSLVADLEVSDALLFQSLASFVWTIDGQQVLVIRDIDDPSTKDLGFIAERVYELPKYTELKHLESIGLVSFEPGRLTLTELQQDCPAYYFDEPPCIPEQLQTGVIRVGNVSLTAWGREILGLCNAEKNLAYRDDMIVLWQRDAEMFKLTGY